jgi:hypothetical protein
VSWASPALLVAGDAAADFALALAWDRLYGRSLWLPSQWQPSLDVNTSEMTATRLELGAPAQQRPSHQSPRFRQATPLSGGRAAYQ